MIDASLNEVEGLAAKAARGAGLSWGLAEDTGRAARWLASQGIDWAASLVAMLGAVGDTVRPMLAEAGKLESQHGDMTPLLAGSHLADLGAAAGDIRLGATAHPVWLLPFAALAAPDRAAVEVSWDRVVARVLPQGVEITGDAGALYAPRTASVSWRIVDAASMEHGKPLDRASRSAVGRDSWIALAAFAAHTYVPASEHSRRAGAGAGLVDND